MHSCCACLDLAGGAADQQQCVDAEREEVDQDRHHRRHRRGSAGGPLAAVLHHPVHLHALLLRRPPRQVAAQSHLRSAVLLQNTLIDQTPRTGQGARVLPVAI